MYGGGDLYSPHNETNQGDPISLSIFNIIMDELLEQLEHESGIKVRDQNISCMAYADDLLVMAEDVKAARGLLKVCQSSFELHYLVVKCSAISVCRAPGQRLFSYTTSQFFIRGKPVQQLAVREMIEYLGSKFSPMGLSKCSIPNLRAQVERICRAPLKSLQKIQIIKFYLIPTYIHSLQSPQVHQQTRESADRAIKWVIKKALHLSVHVSDAFIYAPMKEGGLGIFSVKDKIPIIVSCSSIEFLQC